MVYHFFCFRIQQFHSAQGRITVHQQQASFEKDVTSGGETFIVRATLHIAYIEDEGASLKGVFYVEERVFECFFSSVLKA